MSLRRNTCGSPGGFSVLELLIAVAIVAVFAGIALPAYAARAKESLLQENAKTLELVLKSHLALGLDTLLRQTDETASAAQLLAQALHDPGADLAATFENPLSGSRLMSARLAPGSQAEIATAIWVTDDQRYSYAHFTPTKATKSQLAGSLVVVLIARDGRISCLEVFYVDSAGERSERATVLGI
jgi:prepilin-type N-terminal cleavage/methylation domain-containing protein